MTEWHDRHTEVIENFLTYLNLKSNMFVLKGGTALAVCYDLDRFSEDIDLDGAGNDLPLLIEEYCKENKYNYRIGKKTINVERFFINYGNESRPLKIEASFRSEPIETDLTTINGVLVYKINPLCIKKAMAYAGRDRIRDLYDLSFICNQYYNELTNETLAIIAETVQSKGVGQFDYLASTDKDKLIDRDKLANDFLDMFERLTLFTEEQISKGDSVLKDRHKYIGGSDLANILGYNEKYGPGKSIYDFARIKAGIAESAFKGNQHTHYGNLLEPKILDYMNQRLNRVFKPDTIVNEDKLLRSNCDGISRGSESDVLLEIKTYGGPEFPYEQYLPQVQMYMEMANIDTCFLVGYQKPEDFYKGESFEKDFSDQYFNTDFDSERLTIRCVDRDREFWKEIYSNIVAFQTCVEELKTNPGMTKEQFDVNFEKELSTTPSLDLGIDLEVL